MNNKSVPLIFDGQCLTLDLTVPDEFCAVCMKVPFIRLTLEMTVNGEACKTSVCRDCLAEHMPGLLTKIEGTDGRSA